jgi:hypothetical protein
MLGITEILGIAGFFIGSGGLAAAIISIRKAKHEVRKIDVESDSLLAESARKLLEPLNDRIDEQDKQISEMVASRKLEIEASEAQRILAIAEVDARRKLELAEIETRHHTEMEELRKEIETLTFCKDEHVIKFQKMDIKIKTLQDKNNKLVNGINILINQLKLNGQCPMWQPNADDCETLDE